MLSWTAELGKNDARSHSYIERLGGRSIGRVGWDKEFVRKLVTALIAEASTLVAHNDNALCEQLFGVDIFAIEQRAVDGQSALLGIVQN